MKYLIEVEAKPGIQIETVWGRDADGRLHRVPVVHQRPVIFPEERPAGELPGAKAGG